MKKKWDMRMLNQNDEFLKVGDVVGFYDHGYIQRLFGVIIEHENEYFCGHLGIWTPKDIFPVSCYSRDNIEVINDFHKLIDVHAHKVYDVIMEARRNNIYVKGTEYVTVYL